MRNIIIVLAFVTMWGQAVPATADSGKFDRGDIAATCHKKTWWNAPTEYFACVGRIVGADGAGNYILKHMYGGMPNSVTNFFSNQKIQFCPPEGRERPVPERQLFPPEAIKGHLCDPSYLE